MPLGFALFRSHPGMLMRYTPASLAVLGALILSASSPLTAAEVHSPLSPQQSLEQFQLDPGLKIELVACEPQIVDPVAMRFDEDGRLWVVEMRDYPHGPAA